MDENKTVEQVNAIFGLFMVFFYIGVGAYLLFFFNSDYLDKPIRIIVGSSFLLFGVFRGFRTYFKIVELFFSGRKNKND
mgnify:FL=1